jgi:hypothetical protein
VPARRVQMIDITASYRPHRLRPNLESCRPTVHAGSASVFKTPSGQDGELPASLLMLVLLLCF